MPKAPTRKETEAKATPPPSDDRTPLERMTDLTRRIISVPKTELDPKASVKTKPRTN